MSTTQQTVYKTFETTVLNYSGHPFLQLVSDTAARYGVAPLTLTYGDAQSSIDSVVRRYASLALPAGARVALALDNRPEMFLHWLALNALGMSVVPLNPQWKSGELSYVFSHSEVTLVVALPERAALITDVTATLEQAVRVLVPDELEQMSPVAQWEALGDEQTECALLYTSGTTGKPKGCVLSNEYFIAMGSWYRDVGGHCAMQPGAERLVTPLPMYHMNAMGTSTMGMLLTGGCIIPLDRFHPSTFWASVAESKATILHYLGVMPVMLMGMQASPEERAHSLRFGFGAGLSGELHTQFEERFGFKLIEAWAMTETGCGVAIIASEEPRNVGTACFGRAPAHIDYRLVDDDGNDVHPGSAGELLIRHAGDNPRYGFFSRYLKDAGATEAAWEGGYFHTGDLVRVDEDGGFHFVDRKKNVIRRSGENIAAVEVEEILLQHPAVTGVAVAAVPDEVRGDEVFACVIGDIEAKDWPNIAKDIVTHCLEHLAYYKAPGYLGLVEALPLTATEKVQRAELKELAQRLVEAGDCIDTRAMKSSRGNS